MKKILTFLFLIFFALSLTSYEKIVTWENEEINTADLTSDGASFNTDKNQNINIGSISYISFNLKEENDEAQKDKLDDVSVKELLKRADVLEKKYPDSSLLVLYDDGIQKLNNDTESTRYSHSRYAVKIMNESELSQSMLSFYHIEGRHESKIIMARSISPEGEVEYLKKSDITYTTPKQGRSSFSGRKDEKIIKATIPNVKVGSIIDFEWETTEASPEDKNQFYVGWFFGGSNPVYESTVKFIIPANKELYFVTNNFEPFSAKPKVTKKDGFKTYYFTRGECAPFTPEPQAPPIEEFYPYVSGSLFKDQTYLSNWLSKFMIERMTPDEKLKELVGKILNKAKAKTEEEKIAAVYRFVQQNIHYRSIKTSLSSGFSGHPATETIANGYGDCIDKSILFSTMLTIANIEAYPVILNTNSRPKALYNKIGVIAGNHAITEIHLYEKGEKTIYLDSTSLTYRYPAFRYDDQGVPVWNPILNTVSEITPLPAPLNTQLFQKEIALAPDGNGEVKSLSVYSGDWEAGLREYFLSAKKQELESVLRSIIASDYPGSILRDYDYGDPTDYTKNLFLKFSYRAFRIAKKTGNFLIMNIPVYHDFSSTTLKERRYPLTFATLNGKKNKISIIIPDGYEVKGLPNPVNIENKYFSYTGKYSKEGSKIIFEDHFEKRDIKVTVKDYKTYRSDMLLVDHFTRTPLILEKK